MKAETGSDALIVQRRLGAPEVNSLPREIIWPDPAPLEPALLPVPAFELHWLPEALRDWVGDIAVRAQCPVDFVAVAALTACSAVVGRQCTIRPKQQDDWTVVPNTWGLVVGRPGVMKTPALLEALRPLKRLELAAKADYRRALEGYRGRLMEHELRVKALKAELGQAIKDGVSTAPVLEKIEAAAAPTEPTERRYTTNDATVEKLGELMNQNPNGLLQFRDELTGFLRSMEREGHENDRAFYNEAWTGTTGYTYDRIGRGTLHIAANCLSVLGGIQPGPLHGYLRDAFRPGRHNDGLIQRFQLAVYPDIGPDWITIDRWPDTEAKASAFGVFQGLAAVDLDALGAHKPTEDDDGLPFLRFTPEGQAVFNAWRLALERRLRAPGDEPDAILAHLAKYPSLLASLALLLHLTEAVSRGAGGPVTADAAVGAVAWCGYLEAHARRIYQGVTDPSAGSAAALAAKLRSGKIPTPFTVRGIYRAQWAGLTTREDVEPGLLVLETRHWVAGETVRSEGRPTRQYRVNPKIHGARA